MKKAVFMAAAAILTFSLSSAVFADDNTAHLKQQLTIAQSRVNEANTLLANLEAAAATNPIAAAQVQNVKAGLPALEAEVAKIQAMLPAEAPAAASAAISTDPAALLALIAQQQGAAVTPAQAEAAALQSQAQAAQAAQLAQAQMAQLLQAQAAQVQTAQAQQQTDATAQAQAAQAAAQAAAQQAAQAVQAATPAAPATPVVAAAVKNFTDKNGTTHTFTMDEWNYLISVWAYTGQGEEMVTHHTIGDLMAVLAARG